MRNELPTIECIETLAYNVKYTASDAACHEMLCDAVMRRIVPSDIALDIAEQYAVRSFTETTANDLKEELDRLDAIERDNSPGCDPPQTEETSEQRIARYREQLAQPCDETPEEKELLDTVERLILSPGECVYYNGTDYLFRKRSWQDICLVDHYEGNTPCRAMDLGQWSRRDALDAIRSLHERLTTV